MSLFAGFWGRSFWVYSIFRFDFELQESIGPSSSTRSKTRESKWNAKSRSDPKVPRFLAVSQDSSTDINGVSHAFSCGQILVLSEHKSRLWLFSRQAEGLGIVIVIKDQRSIRLCRREGSCFCGRAREGFPLALHRVIVIRGNAAVVLAPFSHILLPIPTSVLSRE